MVGAAAVVTCVLHHQQPWLVLATVQAGLDLALIGNAVAVEVIGDHPIAIRIRRVDVALVGNPVAVAVLAGAVGDVAVVGDAVAVAVRLALVRNAVVVAVVTAGRHRDDLLAGGLIAATVRGCPDDAGLAERIRRIEREPVAANPNGVRIGIAIVRHLRLARNDVAGTLLELVDRDRHVGRADHPGSLIVDQLDLL